MLWIYAAGLGMGGSSAAPTVTIAAVISFAVRFAHVQEASAQFARVQSQAPQFARVQSLDVTFSQR